MRERTVGLLFAFVLLASCNGGGGENPTEPFACNPIWNGEMRFTTSSACSPLTSDTTIVTQSASSCTLTADVASEAQRAKGQHFNMTLNMSTRTATLVSNATPCDGTDNGTIDVIGGTRIVATMKRTKQSCCAGQYLIVFYPPGT
ncbi:MAG TPA: hypothetical protein VFN10_10430 [Thermoanaerobaculia bacterium]|jgi:hypothetical protein|nr:hypothetical protein [Thermoanaerobaculia bacterium]